jgi:hypothetical protein
MSQTQPMLPQFQAMLERNEADPPSHRIAEPILPPWNDNKRGAPNSFLRCALFAATKGTERVEVEDQVLDGQKNILVKYSGPQLNQSDLDVWETLVHLARKDELGKTCSFTTYGILKALGHNNAGNSDHKWVDAIIKRLTKAYVEVTHGAHPEITYFGHLINGGKKNYKTKHYDIQLDKNLLALYDPAHWTAIDWEQRKSLRGQDLAKYLHAFYSTHRIPFDLSVKTLHAWTGSRNPQVAGFKRQLTQALNSLKEIGFLTDGKIQNGMVIVKRNHAQATSLKIKYD